MIGGGCRGRDAMAILGRSVAIIRRVIIILNVIWKYIVMIMGGCGIQLPYVGIESYKFLKNDMPRS